MGLIRAAVGALGGSLADQWKDFHTVPQDLPQTAAVFPALRNGSNAGRGSNLQASDSIISNGSKIVVPEGYGLLTFQDGQVTSFVAEPGAYTWDSENLDSKTIFADGGFVAPIVKQSWQRFKFGGRPGAQQIALFVSLKELPNNKFGTQSVIYWDDSYLNAQVGATARGTYTLKIIDPILFVKSLLPASYLQNAEVFDFTDVGNQVATQLFTEVVSSLAGAFSRYTNDPKMGNRILNIQRDSVGFALSMSQSVEESYKWSVDRGLTIAKVAIVGIEYDEATLELLRVVQRADALSGSRGNSNLQASVAAGLETAGGVDGAAGIFGLGVAANNVGISGLQQPATGSGKSVPTVENPPSVTNQTSEASLVDRLGQLKSALDAGLITQSEYDLSRAKALGL